MTVRLFASIVSLAGLVMASAVSGLSFIDAGTAEAQTGRSAPERFSIEDLQRAEAARDQAVARLRRLEAASAAAERELSAIDSDLMSAAEDSRRREEAAFAGEARMAELNGDLASARRRLESDRDAHEDLITALLALSKRSPAAMTASPEDRSRAIRAAILMSAASPALRTRADALVAEIENLNRLRADIRREQDELRLTEAGLAARRIEITALQAEKRRASREMARERDRLARETEARAREAATLKSLLDDLTRTAPTGPGRKPAAPARPEPTAGGRPPAAKGAKPVAPAVGARMIRTQPGARDPGVVFSTRAAAQVVAPATGRVEFSGPFRSYGQMLILNVGDDILVVVSGMEAVFAEVGQRVLAGEPIGRMADRASPGPELYLEVRKSGKPVDAETWLNGG